MRRDSDRSLGARGLDAFLRTLVVAVLALLAGPAASQALPSSEPFELLPDSFQVVPSSLQAGAHADLTTEFDFAHNEAGQTFNDLKNTVVNLPVGFIGNSTAVPMCRQSQLEGASLPEEGIPGTQCPPASQVGTITLDITVNSKFGAVKSTFPVYNMQATSFGVAAELGFKTISITADLLISVRPGDSGLTVTSANVEKRGEVHGISVTTWGVPASPVHDPERGRECFSLGSAEQLECVNGGESANLLAIKPFLTNPTSCGMFTATMKADSWEEPEPENWLRAPVELGRLGASTEVGPIVGCEGVPFDPSIEVQPTTRAAESPSGLDLSVLVPQRWEEPLSLSTANLKDARVTLPVGFTVNPSAGSGLAACTAAQYEAETSSSLPGQGCPPESKIGSIEIETPVLSEKAFGSVYVATPFENPFGSLLGLYIVARIPDRGVLVKVAGQIQPDPVTGQLVTTFLNNPQAPFTRFTLKFRPGATAPLVSPPACGTFTTQAALTPWSAPLEPRLVSKSFQITQGVHEGACPSGGVPPFKPQVVTGTQNNAAGSYSPFYLRITREDGEQELTRFSTVLPPGLTGNLTGIPFCSEAAIEAARRHTGAQENNEPSCPAASQVGHTIVGAGVGAILAQTPGRLYLAGPYHGAPLSLVSVTSATVGPFDLGTVVIRFALRINPTTAQVEVDATGSDPIPHIIQGIVVHVRDIRAYIDRPNFILNPTSCNRLAISNVVTGAGADFTNPADQVPVSVSSPFQAADCSSLQFKPAFKVTTSGKTSRSGGASLTAKLAFPAGALGTEANIKQVKVDLPKQLPSRLTTLQKACTAAQFNTNPAGCPAASVVGHAKAITPLIPVPLEGPAYFVSHGGEAFPSLIVVLQGYGITIDLVGTTFISKQGITSSTFKTVPDQPVTSFEITLPEGPYSALTALGNLCTATRTVTVKKKITVKVHGRRKTITRKVKKTEPATLTMPTEFLAQNGAEIHQTTPIAVTGCPKARPAKKAKGGRKKR